MHLFEWKNCYCSGWLRLQRIFAIWPFVNFFQFRGRKLLFAAVLVNLFLVISYLTGLHLFLIEYFVTRPFLLPPTTAKVINASSFNRQCASVNPCAYTRDLDIDLNCLYASKQLNSDYGNKIGKEYQLPNPINQFTFNFTYLPHGICPAQGEKTLDLLVLIKSNPISKIMRDNIRRSWAAPGCWAATGYLVKHMFVVGHFFSAGMHSLALQHSNKMLKDEVNTTNDIALLDIEDSYYNLTYKLLANLQLIAGPCQNIKHAMILDDDFFINPHRLKALLYEISSNQYPNLMAGVVWINQEVHRNAGKWAVSYKDYPKPFYMPFASGGTLLFSVEMARRLLFAASYTKIFRFDDVYLGWLMCRLNLGFWNLTGISLDEKPKPNKLNQFLTSHGYRQPEDVAAATTALGLKKFCQV